MKTTRSDENNAGVRSVWRMFDAIAPRYDLLNRLLSCGQDVRWRRALAESVADARFERLLDAATGTGDVLMAVAGSGGRFCTGVDMAGEMLERAREKLRAYPAGGGSFALARCDACELPLASGSFDAVTIAFGIRNVSDVGRALREMFRVIRPGGRLAVLEFSLPASRATRMAYLLYFRRVLPVIGGLISGDYAAYRYLNRSVEAFPYGQAFCDIMIDSGFHDVAARPLTCGVATIYTGEKTRA